MSEFSGPVATNYLENVFTPNISPSLHKVSKSGIAGINSPLYN